jgi:guanylate kinase
MSGIVYILSAPSGAGKSTLAARLRQMFPGIEFSVSYTTREPRGNEQHGREYFFVSRPEFEAMLRRGEFLEHAEVFGNYYGTARRTVEETLERGHDLLLDIDVQGARQILQHMPDAVAIFILPPSRQVLEERLRGRSQAENAASEAVIQRRLETASREISNYPQYGYILVNDRLEDSIEQLKAIVLAERLKRAAAQPTAEEARLLEIAGHCLQSRVEPRVRAIQASFRAPVAAGEAKRGAP